jgi:hypothetical protein
MCSMHSTGSPSSWDCSSQAHDAPGVGSAAVDAADRAESPDHDIAGHARPIGSAPDIGACERP